MLRLLTFTIVLGVVAPAVADARRPTARAMKIATSTWGAAPCGGKVSVLTRQASPTFLTSDSTAWAGFDTPLGANNLAAAATWYTHCTISLSAARWPTRASMILDWDALCMTVTHEVGHLLGHAHESTPGSVMAAVFSDYSGEPAGCRATQPRY